jgi:hypothetical protein
MAKMPKKATVKIVKETRLEILASGVWLNF